MTFRDAGHGRHPVDHHAEFHAHVTTHDGSSLALDVPTAITPTLPPLFAIVSIHNSTLTGHLGWRKTLSILRRQFHWPRMRQDVRTYVLRCLECQFSKAHHRTRRVGRLVPLKYKYDMQILSIDFVGPISPISARGMRYILVVICNFSNLVWFIPTPDESSATAAEALLNIFLQYGFPERLLSDRGTFFLASKVSAGYAQNLSSDRVIILAHDSRVG